MHKTLILLVILLGVNLSCYHQALLQQASWSEAWECCMNAATMLPNCAAEYFSVYLTGSLPSKLHILLFLVALLAL